MLVAGDAESFGVRRLDAALLLVAHLAFIQSGVEPPHSKAFGAFLGTHPLAYPSLALRCVGTLHDTANYLRRSPGSKD
jgi:hypothetical protein